MKKSRKLLLAAAAVLLLALCCACSETDGAGALDDRSEYPLVFFSDTDAEILCIGVDYGEEDGPTGGERAMNANSSPLRRGESLGFQVGGWPAVVTAYADLQCRTVLARLTVDEAPPEGERWYVTAGGSDGVELALSSRRPW